LDIVHTLPENLEGSLAAAACPANEKSRQVSLAAPIQL
jgi:hypothetical protein